MQMAQIQIGIANYIEQEIAAKATGLKKFTVYATSILLLKKVETITSKLMENEYIAALGIISSTGDWDLDLLEVVLASAMEKVGKLEVMGIIFNVDDVSSLFKYIRTEEV